MGHTPEDEPGDDKRGETEPNELWSLRSKMETMTDYGIEKKNDGEENGTG